jgi:ABC-type transport system involved in cytochrome c biogenesis permease subunit
LESTFLLFALIAYAICLGLFLIKNDQWAGIALIFAVLIHLGGLIARSIIAHHPPFTNIYETFILLPFLVALRLLFRKEYIGEKPRKILIGVVMAIILIALLLPQSLKIPKPLMPALNSIWMYIHVPSYFFAYMALLVAGIYAVMLLFRKAGSESAAILHKLDSEVKIAFFFLNVGLITGGIWAYVSWGNYWHWDPKETWALINIIVLAYYFHLQAPTKRKKAVIVIITLLTVAFTYWGVSFILAGLHSYT